MDKNGKRNLDDANNNDTAMKRMKSDIANEIQEIQSILRLDETIARNALELYLDHPNRFNLAVTFCLENFVIIKKNNQAADEVVPKNDLDVEMKEAELAKDFNKEISSLTEGLLGIFPDADPEYIHNELTKIWDQPNKEELLCLKMMDPKCKYPLLKDKQPINQVQEAINCNVSIEKFLKMFPEPRDNFIGEKRPQLTFDYVTLALSHLMKDFNKLYASYIRTVFAKMGQNYCLTYEELTKRSNAPNGIDPKYFLKNKRDNAPLKHIQCEFFHWEKFYAENRKRIDGFEEENQLLRRKKVAEAIINLELKTCECCYDEEVLFEEMINCDEGHLFCKACLKRCVEVGVGQGQLKYACFDSKCSASFSLSVIETVIDAKLFSSLLKLSMEDELRTADIPDLVSCPFCSFCVIMPNENDKVFRCLNPECLKESCRLCKEPSHIPLRCNEVEKTLETKMRTFIENYMANAMLRTCYACKKRFYKVEGCNKMTCQCGAKMCYLCREPVKDYDHFGTKCQLQTDINKLHAEELEKASIEARKIFSVDYPEAATITLKKSDKKEIIMESTSISTPTIYLNYSDSDSDDDSYFLDFSRYHDYDDDDDDDDNDDNDTNLNDDDDDDDD